MKKFAKVLICFMLCVFSVTLFACGQNKGDKFLQSSVSGEIYSNGGMVVQNGDFIYFNNGFVHEEDQIKNKKNYVAGSLIAAKLENEQPVFDSNGFIDEGQTRYISRRLTSYEAGDVFIFGNYIYYTSPCQENIKGGGGWARERVVFYRKHLNNSGKEEKLYKTKSDYDEVEFSYATQGDELYLLIKDGDKLIRKSANGKNTVEISSSFEKFAFEKNGTHLAYVVNQDGKYILKAYNAISDTQINEKEIKFSVYDSLTSAPEILYADDEFIYLNATVSEGNVLLRASYNNMDFQILYRDAGKKMSYNFYNGVIIALDSGKFYRVENEKLVPILFDSASSAIVAGFANGMLIYIDGSSIKAVDIRAQQQKSAPDITIDSGLTILSGYYDVVGSNFYFYGQVNSGYYLHYVNLMDNNKPKMLGIYNEEDMPEVKDNLEGN